MLSDLAELGIYRMVVAAYHRDWSFLSCCVARIAKRGTSELSQGSFGRESRRDEHVRANTLPSLKNHHTSQVWETPPVGILQDVGSFLL